MTGLLKEIDAILDDVSFPHDPRVEYPNVYVLDNDFIHATFDTKSCALISLVEKETDAVLVSPERPGGLRHIREDDILMGTAWVVGRYMDVVPLDKGVQVLSYNRSGALRQSLSYSVPMGISQIKVTVSLDAGSRGLDYAVDAHWQEIGCKGTGVPQL